MSDDATFAHAVHSTGPLVGSGERASALPAPMTQLVGRESEVRHVLGLLDGDETRLLTLMGPGGVGKTRLAIEAARAVEADFTDGVCFLALASIRDAGLVLPSIARALGIKTRADQTLWDVVTNALHAHHLLLVLDNFEHLLTEAPTWLPELLGRCPRIKVLATSRTALHIYGEHRYLVPPLSVPESGLGTRSETLDASSVSLFIQRARSLGAAVSIDEADAESIGEICRRLDGLPLAIELAAARSNVFAPAEIVTRLTDRFTLLASGQRDAPTRQQSMRDAIDWSYELLTGEEQQFFRQLSVFVGGFTLDAAEAVCGNGDRALGGILAGITSLVNQSLVRRVDSRNGEPRYRMLETIREFGTEQLAASGEQDLVRTRHAEWCRDLAKSEASEFHPFEHVEHIDQLETEYANLRAALEWLDTSNQYTTLAELVVRLRWLWYLGAHWHEGVYWLERVLALPHQQPATIRCDLERGAGQLLHVSGSLGAGECFERALTTSREIGDIHREAEAVFQLALIAEDSGTYVDAKAGFQAARDLYVRVDDAWSQQVCDYHLGVIAYGNGDLEAAKATLEAASAAAVRMEDRLLPLWCTAYLILVACDQDDRGLATKLLGKQRAVTMQGFAHHWETLIASAGVIASTSGQHECAAQLFGAMAAMRHDAPEDLPEAEAYERARERARQHLGTERFESAIDVGGRMRRPDIEAEIDRLLAGVSDPSIQPVAPDPGGTGLTPRELEVLRLMADGLSNQEISDMLYISVRTATSHATNILTKLNLRSRTAAVAFAIRSGLA